MSVGDCTFCVVLTVVDLMVEKHTDSGRDRDRQKQKYKDRHTKKRTETDRN